MAQYIKQGDIFGRVGTGIGQGLAEQIPKEIERGRLASGLKELGQQKDLTPFQQFASLSSIPGITPQMIQSGSELLRHQAQREAYNRRRSDNPQSPKASPDFTDQNLNKSLENFGKITSQGNLRPEVIPSNFRSNEEQALNDSAQNIPNPLSKELIPRKPYSPEEFEDEVYDELLRNPSLSISDARDKVRERESRMMAMPEAERAQVEYSKATRSQLDDEFDNQLKTILQKEGKEIYSDLSGDSILNLKKAAYNDLTTNPRLNERSAAEKWIRKGKDLARAKSTLKEKANRDVFDKNFPSKKEETLKSLMSASKIFAETGNSNEFYDILRTENSPARYGFDLSPGGAAIIAYPRSEPVKKTINEYGKFRVSPNDTIKGKNPSVYTRKLAQEIGKNIRPEDSLLAISTQVKQTNPDFNESAFFDYFRENQDNLGLTPHMKEELIQGVSDLTPEWGDIFLFPFFEKSVAND
jgi:hypothetical protein